MALTWISNDFDRNTKAYITIEKQRRLFISAGARRVIGLPTDGPFYLSVAYDAAEKRIVVAKPELVKQPDVKPFKFDKRGNVSAWPFLRKIGINIDKLPQRYYLIGDGEASKQPYLAYPKHTFAFQLDES
ncbi:hypothetical protein OIO07_23155 [Bacillus paralicheniformis]|uniref:hypothetical protein n=2 Tax=Bacillus paralicheniformis TaxID=1648923 RepID=UPI0021F48F38|nr:hypothetical protein [Bacillus paralicheniformis]MCV9371111.1 hypothetical protein [Bacillus paralicheniformis]WIG10013.1 hypothetical protein QN340_22925 [Bacillus paralicheniformis]